MATLTWKTRFWLFLYSRRNIVASSLALGGLGLYFFGVIDDWWPIIVAGLYFCGWFAVPTDKQADSLEHRELAQADLIEQLDDLIRRATKGLPKEALEKLSAIRSIVATLLPRMHEMAEAGAGAVEQLFTITQAVTRDLPNTLSNYLRLPTAFAQLHTLDNGKTAKLLLIEQLDLLHGHLNQLAQSAHRHDIDALVVNGQFLKEKFHAFEFIKPAHALEADTKKL